MKFADPWSIRTASSWLEWWKKHSQCKSGSCKVSWGPNLEPAQRSSCLFLLIKGNHEANLDSRNRGNRLHLWGRNWGSGWLLSTTVGSPWHPLQKLAWGRYILPMRRPWQMIYVCHISYNLLGGKSKPESCFSDQYCTTIWALLWHFCSIVTCWK